MSDSLRKSYVVGRYYFTTLFKQLAEESFLGDIAQKPYFEEGNFEYALGDFTSEEIAGVILSRGTFGRVRKGQLADIYDHDKKEFKKQALPALVDKKIEFIIDHKSHLVFIEEDNLLNPKIFLGKFKKIYQRSSSRAEFEIDFIVEEKDVYETIKKWQMVKTISFTGLRPSNPSSLDDFAEIEAMLKETQSARTNIEFYSPQVDNKEGLNYESKLIKQSLALSSHGYGNARIEGEFNGEKKKLETNSFVRRVTIDFTKDGALNKIVQEIIDINKDEKNG